MVNTIEPQVGLHHVFSFKGNSPVDFRDEGDRGVGIRKHFSVVIQSWWNRSTEAAMHDEAQ